MHEGSRRAVIAAFFANLGIAVAKLVAFAFTGAASMLAEAVHSAADTGNQGLLALGARRARRKPTASHPFGYGRERYFWAFVVALVLFSLGAVFALVEGIDKLRHPHDVESLGWAVGVLTVAIALESASLRTAVRAAQEARAGHSWWTFIRRSRSPELPVVLLEDVGALTGLVIALVGVSLAEVTDNARFDAAGSLAIGSLLAVIAAVLAVEMKSLLMGETAAPEEEAAIVAAALEAPACRRVIHFRTQHVGPDELLVALKVELDDTLDYEGIVDAIDDIEDRVRRVVLQARYLFVEPARYRVAS